MNKWTFRAAVITGTLGLLGSVIILFATIKKTPVKERVAQISTPTITSNLPKENENKRPEQTEVENREEIKETAKPEVKTVKIEPKKETTKKKTVPTETVTEVDKSVDEPVKKKQKLTEEDLQDLVDAMTALKARNQLIKNCVKLKTIEGRANESALTRIETLLATKNFYITGREVVSSARPGLNISSTGNCIVVTIGRL